MTQLRYAAYLRKSSEAREKQALSIKSQKEELRQKFPDLNITEWIAEERSAFVPYNRPNFDRMMEMALRNKIDGVVAWHPDRVSRNEIEAGTFTYAVRTGVIKNLQFASYNFTNSPEGIKQLQDSLTDSQYSSAKLSVDVKRGLKSKLKMGRRPCQAPIGYLNTKWSTRGDNKIIKDPERFDTIRKMWNLMLTSNYTTPHIRDIATKEWNLRTLKKKKIGGGEMGYSSAYDMFSNIFYTGSFYYKGQMYQGDHEPMITMAEFDYVQSLMKEKGKPRPKTYSFAYGSGCLKCGECHYSFVGIEKNKFIKTLGKLKQYVFYLCGSKKRKIDCKQNANINEIRLEEQIASEISKYAIDENFLHWALEVIKENDFADNQAENQIEENRVKGLESKQKELKRLIDMAMRGLISDEEFKTSRQELDAQIAALKSQTVEEENEKKEDLMELTEKAFVFSTYALERLKNGDKQTKKEIVKNLGLNRTITDEKLSIEAYEWFVEIRKGYFSLREVMARFEPEARLHQKTIYDFPTLLSQLRGWPDLNR